MQQEKVQQLIQLAKQAGADGADYIRGEQIVLDPQFREICRGNGCGRYNRCYMCPPDIGPVEQLMEKVRKYPHAVIYQSISPLEDPFDFEGMMDAGERHTKISVQVNSGIGQILQTGYLHLANSCRLCSRCAKMDGEPCRHPDQALGPVEGYGIDVYQTVKDSSLKYINGENTVTYFSMILFTE